MRAGGGGEYSKCYDLATDPLRFAMIDWLWYDSLRFTHYAPLTEDSFIHTDWKILSSRREGEGRYPLLCKSESGIIRGGARTKVLFRVTYIHTIRQGTLRLLFVL